MLVPLLAAALGADARSTAGVGLLGLVVGIAMATIDGFSGTSDDVVPLIILSAGGVIAYYIARLRAQRENDRRRLEVQFQVARTLQEAHTLEEGAPALIEAIGVALGWELGGLWQVRRPRVLRCVANWYAPGVDPTGFDKLSRDFVLRSGAGLPGRVLETGRPAWVADVTTERGMPRAELAARAGLRAAVAFPLSTSAGVVGVLEFFGHEIGEPDPALLELIDALGGQIGEFIEGEAAAQALRESESRKTAMFDAALDCVITVDADGMVIEFNPAAERTFGYSAQEAVGRDLAELIVPPALRAVYREGLTHCVRDGDERVIRKRLELEGMHADGHEFPVELTISRIGSDPPTFTGFLRDITARRAAETERERLLQAERISREDADRAREQLAAILSGIADAVTAQAEDGRLLFANEAAVKRLGMRSEHELLEAAPGELMSRYEVFDEEGRPFPHERLPGRRALAGEAAPEAVVRQISPGTGAESWTRIKATPIRDDAGRVVMAINVVEDITDLKRAERAQRLLAEAGGVLASPLDARDLLERVVELPVPSLADWCAIHLLCPDGSTQLVAQHSTDAGFTRLMSDMAERFPPDHDSEVGLPHAIRSGRGALYQAMTPELLDLRATSPEHAEMLRAMGPHGGIVVPVASGHTVLGGMAFVRRGEGLRYGQEDLEVAEELGRRVGTALDNARLYAERSHIARTLQESLLPSRLPDIPGIETAARFRPAGDGFEVGGDFYDLFQGEGNSWSVVMGDVCGKGPDAAAVAALARYTLRAAAMSEPGPSAGLRMLNEALLQQRGDLRFATVAYATLVPEGDGVRLAVASAGHPLPLLLRRDGTVETVGKGGTLAGVVPDPDIDDHADRLEPGDALVLYTDGVIEARDDPGILGDGMLRELLEACAGMAPDAIAERIERVAVERQNGITRDDIAVVVLRATGHPSRDVGRPTRTG